MFSQTSDLKIGDVVIVGTVINDKFVPNIARATARVESIVHGRSNDMLIGLDWGAKTGKSKIHGHDEGTTWVRVQNYN